MITNERFDELIKKAEASAQRAPEYSYSAVFATVLTSALAVETSVNTRAWREMLKLLSSTDAVKALNNLKERLG